jgi:hypothetical protein
MWHYFADFFVSFYVYIKSRLFGELNGSCFRNKAQYLVSIFYILLRFIYTSIDCDRFEFDRIDI